MRPCPLVANSLGDGVSALKVIHELPLVVVDQDLGCISSLCDVEWLKLAATCAAKREPNQDAMFETATLDDKHDRIQRVSIHDSIAKGDAYHQAMWIMVCHLAEGRRLTTTKLNQERCKEVGKQAGRAEAAPKKQVSPSWFSGASPGKAEAG